MSQLRNKPISKSNWNMTHLTHTRNTNQTGNCCSSDTRGNIHSTRPPLLRPLPLHRTRQSAVVYHTATQAGDRCQLNTPVELLYHTRIIQTMSDSVFSIWILHVLCLYVACYLYSVLLCAAFGIIKDNELIMRIKTIMMPKITTVMMVTTMTLMMTLMMTIRKMMTTMIMIMMMIRLPHLAGWRPTLHWATPKNWWSTGISQSPHHRGKLCVAATSAVTTKPLPQALARFVEKKIGLSIL